MPKYEIQLVRWFKNCDVAYIEVEAKDVDEAREIALARTGDDNDINWSEGNDYEVEDYVIGDPDEIPED